MGRTSVSSNAFEIRPHDPPSTCTLGADKRSNRGGEKTESVCLALADADKPSHMQDKSEVVSSS